MAERPVSIITGGSRGIGKGIAVELATLGFDIVISHFDFDAKGGPDYSKAIETQKEIKAMNVECEVLRADVSNGEDRDKLVELTKSTFGRCDMLINRVMGINLRGPYFLTQQVANWMIEQKKVNPERAFRIVNTSSMSAYTSSPARGEYCVSKAGISMMTMLYADRLAEYGIGVFEIRPGIIATDMTSVVKEKYDKLIAEGLTPIKRWGQPEDIGKAVGAIAEGRFDFSTGQVINVDGGFHFRRL
jgi:3-oxoacyl-[acyl-carrier protein] reductase